MFYTEIDCSRDNTQYSYAVQKKKKILQNTNTPTYTYCTNGNLGRFAWGREKFDLRPRARD